MRRVVLLLKDARAADGLDPYTAALERRGYGADMIGVLEHELDNVEALAEIARTQRESYAGVIVTSQRAVEAWARAAEGATWADVPFYAVATATADALVRAGVPAASIFGAEEAGTGEKLASFMLARLRTAPPDRPLLYLVGDKRRDTIARALTDGGIAIEEMQVYSTRVRREFPLDFRIALGAALEHSATVWVALFSPSGMNAALPVIRELGVFDRVRFAAIGPTTREALAGEQLVAHAVAARPDAEALAEALSMADESA